MAGKVTSHVLILLNAEWVDLPTYLMRICVPQSIIQLVMGRSQWRSLTQTLHFFFFFSFFSLVFQSF